MALEKKPGTERLPARRVPLRRGFVVVQDGPGAGQRIAVDGVPVVIGSDPDADLPLADRSVSRRHARLAAAGGDFALSDLDSTNGTFVNGNRIREVYLKSGDRIQIGRSQLRFEAKTEEVQIPASTATSFGPLYGESVAMRHVFGLLERIAASDATLLVTGETGTGKDLVGRAVHESSPRRDQPFVVFDCSAVSPDLIGSELFGHAAGAFTGAAQKRRGAFESATGGTVFLDEIGELPLDTQPKLLRVLENREVRPLGTSTAVPVNVRVIAATHRDLEAMVAKGAFRQDLFYRLAVVGVQLPPLRDRREDVPGIVERLVRALPGARSGVRFTPEAVSALEAHSWPGNVRELRNVVERTLALATGPEVDARDLMLAEAGPKDGAPQLSGTLDQIEAIAIRHALDRSGGRLSDAAKSLGIHRNTLRAKMKRHGLYDPGDDEPES